MDFDPDNYAEYGFADGLYHEEDRDGVTAYVIPYPPEFHADWKRVCHGTSTAGCRGTGDDLDYDIDNGESQIGRSSVGVLSYDIPFCDLLATKRRFLSRREFAFHMKDYKVSVSEMIKNRLF